MYHEIESVKNTHQLNKPKFWLLRRAPDLLGAPICFKHRENYRKILGKTWVPNAKEVKLLVRLSYENSKIVAKFFFIYLALLDWITSNGFNVILLLYIHGFLTTGFRFSKAQFRCDWVFSWQGSGFSAKIMEAVSTFNPHGSSLLVTVPLLWKNINFLRFVCSMLGQR